MLNDGNDNDNTNTVRVAPRLAEAYFDTRKERSN